VHRKNDRKSQLKQLKSKCGRDEAGSKADASQKARKDLANEHGAEHLQQLSAVWELRVWM
jgi:hypothetical protein